jgi:Histone methylation protein DOT1
MDSVNQIREALRLSLEGGQYHAREKIKESGGLAYSDFLSIGLALKECFVNPKRHEEFIERLKPHVDIIIGVLPPGIQSQGLLPTPEELADPHFKPLELKDVTDKQLRQWIVDDGSLVYGELTGEELLKYFAELGPLIQAGGSFVDLGSGLGKVVMTAGLQFPFAMCKGIEIVQYRHRMACERFMGLLKQAQESLNQLKVAVSAEDPIELPWTSAMRLSHLLDLPKRTRFQMGDMFTCNVSDASLVFIYSTCFGSFIHKLAHKLANEAPEGCLVTTTTIQINHPGLLLIKKLPAKTVAWTDIFVYKRVGAGPWPEQLPPPVYTPNLDEWEMKAREILQQLE